MAGFEIGDYVYCWNNRINMYEVAAIRGNQMDIIMPDGRSYPVPTKDCTLARKKGPNNMLNDLRSYVKDNRQLLYTIALVVALDHFLFNGAFRERIKGLVESLLSSAEKKIG